MKFTSMFQMLVAVGLQAALPAMACSNPMVAEGEQLSAEGGATFIRLALANPELSVHMKMAPIIRERLEVAVAAERPDWRLIEGLQSEEIGWRAELERLSHKGTLRILRELNRRDKAIYLIHELSGPERSSPPGFVMEENSRRTKAIQLEILKSANCLIPDEPNLIKLLFERHQLELERQKLASAWADGVHAAETLPKRLERLREFYRRRAPPVIMTQTPDQGTPRDPEQGARKPR